MSLQLIFFSPKKYKLDFLDKIWFKNLYSSSKKEGKFWIPEMKNIRELDREVHIMIQQ